MPEEICQRCGEPGTDRRTLFMACFYAMEEMDIPFDRETLFKAVEVDSVDVKNSPKSLETERGPVTLSSGTLQFSGELSPVGMHTLRVCKDCRASWMGAIQKWFDGNEPPEIEECSGSGIFIRHRGTNVEISRETFDRMNPGRQPVIFRSDDDADT